MNSNPVSATPSSLAPNIHRARQEGVAMESPPWGDEGADSLVRAVKRLGRGGAEEGVPRLQRRRYGHGGQEGRRWEGPWHGNGDFF